MVKEMLPKSGYCAANVGGIITAFPAALPAEVFQCARNV